MNLIHTYTRAQAITDGTLVDVTTTAREAGIRYPVALTSAVWEDCVAWDDAAETRTRALQDEAGRLWDVVFMASVAARRATGARATYRIVRVPRDGDGCEPLPVDLVMVVGPGDEGEPVITIQQPDED